MLQERELLRLRLDISGRIWLQGNGFRRELNVQELQELAWAIRRAGCRGDQSWGQRVNLASSAQSLGPKERTAHVESFWVAFGGIRRGRLRRPYFFPRRGAQFAASFAQP